jgi:hypothetical protein
LGSFIGDHAKTGIGTRLNSGTIIGYGASVWGSEFQAKVVPPFTWGSPGEYGLADIEKWLLTSKRVLARREQTLSPLEETIIRETYKEALS